MGTLANLNYIREAAAYPCAHPNPVITLVAAHDAIFPVLMSAASFGCRDIVKMKAGISPWHTRSMRALVEGVIKPDDGWGAGKLLKFTIPIEKALFFFFVVDLTTEFLARWQSNIFKLGACGAPAFDCNWTGDNPAGVTPGGTGFAPLSYSTANVTGSCPLGISNGFAVPNEWYFSVSFTVTPKPIFGTQPVGWCDTRLRRVAHGIHNFPAHRAEAPWFGNKVIGKYYVSGQNKTHGVALYFFEFSTDVASAADTGNATVTISDKPIYNQSIIPVNCLGQNATGLGELFPG